MPCQIVMMISPVNRANGHGQNGMEPMPRWPHPRGHDDAIVTTAPQNVGQAAGSTRWLGRLLLWVLLVMVVVMVMVLVWKSTICNAIPTALHGASSSRPNLNTSANKVSHFPCRERNSKGISFVLFFNILLGCNFGN